MKFTLFLSIFLSIVFFNCEKKKCTGIVARDLKISFQLIDTNGMELIGDFWRTYDKENVEFTTESGHAPSYLYISGNGFFSFNLLDSGEQYLDTIQNVYYLKLPPTALNPDVDIDTIRTVIVIDKEADCKESYIDYISVYYNNKLYFSSKSVPNPFKFVKI